MPKLRQIPRLFVDVLSDGRRSFHWKPSKTLRAQGFVNVKLGYDEGTAIAEALNLNRQVLVLRSGETPGAPAAARIVLPRVVRVGELMARYRKSDAFTMLRPTSQKNYETRLRQLEHWALDGQLAVRDIDRDMVRSLRNALVAGSSPWVAASTLAVLRLLLAWARDEGIVRDNVALEANVPEPPARKVQMGRAVRDAIVTAADALGLDDVALAIPLAEWMIQRQADVLQLGRFGWRPIDLATLDIDPRHVARLVGPKGRAMAFRLAQQKTGTWIDAPLPPFLHDRVEERMRASSGGYLFPDVEDHRYRAPIVHDRPMPGWKFQRRFREAQAAAWAVALMDGDADLAAAIDAAQFRDLRRTGMIAYKDAGAVVQNITALSGHAVLGRKTILDTYMPGDTAGACACVAAGIRAHQARERREKTG